MSYATSSLNIPANMSPAAMDEYMRERVTVKRETRKGTFYKVIQPLSVFKKVHRFERVSAFGGIGYTNRRNEAIANLIIPVGAVVFCKRLDGKFRASRAIVHSIVEYNTTVGVRANSLGTLFAGYQDTTALPDDFVVEWLRRVDNAVSGYAINFVYKVGATVTPVRRFSDTADECASGIHFFLNVRRALAY